MISVNPETFRAVVLVEGLSDQRALEALAARHNRDLAAEGISIVALGGATNVAASLERFGPQGLGLRVTGLCDAGEEHAFRRAIARAGIGSPGTRAEMELLGFFVCVEDLEDELILALGVDAVERVIESLGELEQLRTFRKQPAWRDRDANEQLRRFLGTHRGRKIHSAPALVRALDPAQVPIPLERLLSAL